LVEDTVLIKSPFQMDAVIGKSSFSCDGCIYYSVSCAEDDSNIRLSERSGRTVYRIMKYSTDTMEEDCIFEMTYERKSDWSFLETVNSFFLDDRRIWFVTRDAIWQADRLICRKELMELPVNGNIAYDGEKMLLFTVIFRRLQIERSQ